MAKPAAKAPLLITGDTITFNQAGSYTIEYLPSGQVKFKLDGGQATVITGAEYAALTHFAFAPGASLDSAIRINGITFHQADASGPFEISQNLDALIGKLVADHGIAWTASNLVINGSQADTFKVLWDYLDDAYVAGNNYYNLPLNETFARLGVEYIHYLQAGGAPLTFVMAKFAADTDNDGIPQRAQSMHDNLLGNVNINSIHDRNYGPVIEQQLLSLVPQEYQNRPYYDGNEQHLGGAAHDAIRAFDYDHGWTRPDYLDITYDGVVDPLAHSGNSMFYGTGNAIDDWTLVRHEGAGVELGLKVKHRGGDEYQEAVIGPGGVAHYFVSGGASPSNSGRAEWNFDFSATDFSPTHDFTYTVELDTDPTAGVHWVTLYSSAHPLDTSLGTGSIFQNSTNIAFYKDLIDTDAATPGIQPYALGDGVFNIRISAFDATDGHFIVSNEVIVHVGGASAIPVGDIPLA